MVVNTVVLKGLKVVQKNVWVYNYAVTHQTLCLELFLNTVRKKLDFFAVCEVNYTKKFLSQAGGEYVGRMRFLH